MARLKNTRELVLRARGHARADHIKQGTYGSGRVNGHADFRGCAIGCLATPHRKRDLQSFLREFLEFTSPRQFSNLTIGSDWQTKKLEDEFGIPPQLARIAEALFEAQPTNGAAIEFIPRFAESLNEGATFTPKDLRSAWRRIAGTGARVSRFQVQFGGGGRSGRNFRSWYRMKSRKAETRRITDDFLAWLREQH